MTNMCWLAHDYTPAAKQFGETNQTRLELSLVDSKINARGSERMFSMRQMGSSKRITAKLSTTNLRSKNANDNDRELHKLL